jgi:hypothetical protein
LSFGVTAVLFFIVSTWSNVDAKVPLSEGESTTRYQALQQKLVDLKVLEDDMQATLDRAKADRDDASWEMAKAKMALPVKMYREAGLLACQFAANTPKGTPAQVYGELCVTGNRLLETNQALSDCKNGKAGGCEELREKLNEYGAKRFKGFAPGKEAKMAEIAVELDAMRSEVERGDQKSYIARACRISAKLSNFGGADDLTKKMELVCKTGKTVASLYEDGKAFVGLWEEAKRLDVVVQANLSQMQAKFDAVKASRQALESRLSALVTAEKEETTGSDKNCDPGLVVNPELARSDEATSQTCKAKKAKKDKVCDENLGCPDDESGTKGPGKDLLAKLDSDLGRIQNSQPGTAGGALSGETLEAGSSFDKTAMLRSFRSGLGAYNQGRERFSSSGGTGGGFSGGNCPNRVPVPQELRAIAQRRGVSVPPDPTIDDMIAQAGSAEAASSGLRQHIQELRQSLAQWPRGSQDETRRQMELEVGYEQAVVQAMECRRGSQSLTRDRTPQISSPPRVPAPYCGNPYQIDCGNDVQCQRKLAAQPKCP